MSNAVTG